MGRIITKYSLPSELLNAPATTLEAGDLLTVQKSGERFLRPIDADDLPYLAESGGFVDIPTSILRAKGIAGRQGSGGATAGNAVNFWWDSPDLEAWVDTSNIGNVLISGNGTIVSEDMAAGAASVSAMVEAGETTITNKDTDYTVVSGSVTISKTCNLLMLYEAAWESGRSQGVRTYGLTATTGFTVGGSSTTLRVFTAQRRDGVAAIDAESRDIQFGSEKLYGVMHHSELWTNITAQTRTCWLKMQRFFDHTTDYGSAKVTSARIIAVELRR